MRFYLYASQEKNIKYFVEEKKKINWVQFQTMLGGGSSIEFIEVFSKQCLFPFTGAQILSKGRSFLRGALKEQHDWLKVITKVD